MSASPPTDHAMRPSAPVDQTVTYAINDGLRRDAARFVSAVRHTPVEDVGTWRLLARRWELFAAVLRLQCRGQDEGLWPALRSRCIPEQAVVLSAMEVEHDALAASVGLGTSLLLQLARRADPDLRAAAVVRVSAVRDCLERHLAHEESDAMPVLQEWLTQEEWERIDRDHYLAQVSPFFLLSLVPWTAYGQPRETLDRVFGLVGRGFQVVWWLTRRGFARRERRTFRHARG